jgi:signal transduction histidine kinase
MKTHCLIAAVIAPLVISSCKNEPETVTEKMEADADQLSESVREMVTATKQRAESAGAEGKERLDRAVVATAAAAEDAKANLKAAKAKTERALEDAAHAVDKAKNEVDEAIHSR